MLYEFLFTNRHYHTPQHRPQWWTPPSIGSFFIYKSNKFRCHTATDTLDVYFCYHNAHSPVDSQNCSSCFYILWTVKYNLLTILCLIPLMRHLISFCEDFDLIFLLNSYFLHLPDFFLSLLPLEMLADICFDTFYYSKHLGHSLYTFYNFNLSQKV